MRLGIFLYRMSMIEIAGIRASKAPRITISHTWPRHTSAVATTSEAVRSSVSG